MTSSQTFWVTSVPFVKRPKMQSLCFSASFATSFQRTIGSPPVIMKKWQPSSFASETILSISSKERFSDFE